jgi:hypothetical protein
MTQEERADLRQTKDRLIASEKGQKSMTRREMMTTALRREDGRSLNSAMQS